MNNFNKDLENLVKKNVTISGENQTLRETNLSTSLEYSVFRIKMIEIFSRK